MPGRAASTVRFCLALCFLLAIVLGGAEAVAQSNGVKFRSIFEVCDDKKPRGGHTCEQQKAWGKCEERWFVDGKYCMQTCGKCKAFDPRTTEVTIRGAMNQCKLKDKQTENSCLDAIQGECAKGNEL